MDYKEIQNDKMKSALIKVEALQKEYEVILQQYQEAGKNYINSLQTANTTNTTDTTNTTNTTDTTNTTNKVEFTALKGRTWWGSNSIKQESVSTQEECESMCANDTKCSGATFNPVKRYCWTRSGDGSITAGTEDDYALIPKQKAALIMMKGLNDKLLKLNEEITNELTNISPEVEEQTQQQNTTQEQLNNSYKHLLEQKIAMEKQLNEYYSIDEENENQELYAGQQNVSYRFWVLLTCIILIVCIKKMTGGEGEGTSSSIIIWICILIILIILTYSLSSPSGFVMWFIVIMSIILMKTGNLPSP